MTTDLDQLSVGEAKNFFRKQGEEIAFFPKHHFQQNEYKQKNYSLKIKDNLKLAAFIYSTANTPESFKNQLVCTSMADWLVVKPVKHSFARNLYKVLKSIDPNRIDMIEGTNTILLHSTNSNVVTL